MERMKKRLRRQQVIVAAGDRHYAVSVPAPPPTRHRPAPACSWCGQALSALRAMRRDVCERPSCLLQFEARELRTARTEVARGLRQQQLHALGTARADALRVLWIMPHDSRLVALPADVKAQHQAYLQDLVTGVGAAEAAPADAASQGGPVSHAEGSLCGWCAGRCCRFGRTKNAYLALPHLRRWQQAHPDSTLQDAAAAYADRLPAQHVEGSCVYHGARGCTLDRTMRSEICNLYTCDGLHDLQQRRAVDRRDDWLFVQGQRAEVVSTLLCADPGPAAAAVAR
jgi:hypothetical protein